MKKTPFIISGVVLGVAVVAGGMLWYQNQNISVSDLSAQTRSQNQVLDEIGNDSEDIVFVNTEDSNQDLESLEQEFSEDGSSGSVNSNTSVDAEIQSLENDLNGSVDQDMESDMNDLQQLF